MSKRNEASIAGAKSNLPETQDPPKWVEGRPTKQGLYVVMMGPEYPGYPDTAAYYEGCHWPSYARKYYGPIPEPD